MTCKSSLMTFVFGRLAMLLKFREEPGLECSNHGLRKVGLIVVGRRCLWG